MFSNNSNVPIHHTHYEQCKSALKTLNSAPILVFPRDLQLSFPSKGYRILLERHVKALRARMLLLLLRRALILRIDYMHTTIIVVIS